MDQRIRYLIIGLAAGAVTGILGSGGGLVLVPLLTFVCKEEDDNPFPCSLSIMLPICLSSLIIQNGFTAVSLRDALPYLIGGSIGGVLAALTAKRVPLAWLHKFFGGILLWSSFKFLFS